MRQAKIRPKCLEIGDPLAAHELAPKLALLLGGDAVRTELGARLAGSTLRALRNSFVVDELDWWAISGKLDLRLRPHKLGTLPLPV